MQAVNNVASRDVFQTFLLSWNTQSAHTTKCILMALMHDYVRRANFTTKPRLRGIFSAFALFVRGYSFKFTALVHSFTQNFATLQFKTRLGGEICSLDVNMHKGY